MLLGLLIGLEELRVGAEEVVFELLDAVGLLVLIYYDGEDVADHQVL